MNYKKYTVKEYANGDKAWFINGKLHREDGPAIEYANGTKYWYLNGKRHREDGPAIEWANGDKYWYLNNVEYSEEEYLKKINKECLGCSYNPVINPVISPSFLNAIDQLEI